MTIFLGCEIKYILISVSLTHSYLEISLRSVIWTCHTFENNYFEIKHKFAKYLKEFLIEF